MGIIRKGQVDEETTDFCDSQSVICVVIVEELAIL